MKVRTRIIMALTTILACQACTHKAKIVDIIPPPLVFDDYMVMKPGNSWIYQDYRLDSVNGAAHPLGTFDSSWVEKDTLINGNTYHKYWDRFPNTAAIDYNIYFFRDSLGYVVDNYGHIVFSSTDFTDTFRTIFSYPDLSHPDTIKVTEQMGFKDVTVTVNAGTFTTSSFRQIWHWPPSLPYGPIREYDYTCAKGIGMIKKTTGFYTSMPDIWERRLERFHLIVY